MPGPDTSDVRVAPPPFYVGGFLVGVALEQAFPIDAPPVGIAAAGAVLGVAGWLALDGAAMLAFRRAGTSLRRTRPSAVFVTGGPYRFSRNPMYLGMACLYAGLALALGVVCALLVLPLVIAAVDQLVVAIEEAYLVRRFGDAYCQYMARVRRWI
jgi:protein-S-isoprenylcysteine O-methyltransferase Ste14